MVWIQGHGRTLTSLDRGRESSKRLRSVYPKVAMAANKLLGRLSDSARRSTLIRSARRALRARAAGQFACLPISANALRIAFSI
jgi:hypothetical protein